MRLRSFAGGFMEMGRVSEIRMSVSDGRLK